jgi:GMP synthase-like glutamine amidotransferase
MKIHCIRHEPFEGLASIESWIRCNGHHISFTRTYLHQRFPDEIAFDMLIIMGGTASVYQSAKDQWMIAEKKLIQKTIKAEKKVLGICLGAQLLASVLGAKVYPGSSREIGWFPVHFTESFLNEFPFLPGNITTFHWHGDTFDIPSGAIKIGSSELTPNQGFLLNRNILAMQFHPEMNLSSIKKIIKAAGHQLCDNSKYIQPAAVITDQTELISLNNQLMFNILDRFTN